MKLPKDWERHSLRDFIEKLESGVSVNAEDIPVSNGSPAVLKVGCVSGGVFYPQENKRILESEIHRAKLTVRKGTVIISRSNTQELVGECAYIKQDYPNLYLSDKTWQTIFKPGAQVDARWLGYLLSSPGVKQKLGNLSNGTSGSMKNISKESFLSLEVITPPPKEQSAIADFLDVLDRNIEQTKKLIAAQIQFKRSLMQQMLTGKKRFKEFEGLEWESMKISDFAKLTLRATLKPDKPFKSLGIRSHGKGTFLKEDFEPEKIELTELYEVKGNDLIVNITFAWEGAIAIAGAQDLGALVSHRFPTYVFDTERAIPEYFRHVIIQKWFVEKLGLISPGGAGRNRVLSKKDFAKLEVLTPPLEEQRRIAAVLNACDKESTLLKQQLDALKRQKRGLMQKLLTGQIRLLQRFSVVCDLRRVSTASGSERGSINGPNEEATLATARGTDPAQPLIANESHAFETAVSETGQ